MASLMEGCWPHRLQSTVQQYSSTGVEAGHRTGRQVLGEILNPTLSTEPNTQSDRQPVVELSLQCSDLLLAWEPLQLSSVFCVVADN